MGSFSIWHWLIVLIIVLLIFGTKRLRNVGQDLGGAVKGFKDAMKGNDEEKPADPAAQLSAREGQTSEDEAKKVKDKPKA